MTVLPVCVRLPSMVPFPVYEIVPAGALAATGLSWSLVPPVATTEPNHEHKSRTTAAPFIESLFISCVLPELTSASDHAAPPEARFRKENGEQVREFPSRSSQVYS